MTRVQFKHHHPHHPD
ncbi:histidine operon leader peptide [Salmonella enterica subsp. enterica serovar Virchow]|nr:histidine operon leader peptide [Salmonella enterica subsp. enterica serovar Virchow]EBX3018403.1 histidine operon leader peptide [Salmonella enterica subsp. enterica serovar Virchow]EDI0399048.1 histidine operon leader peptide [Salmonella enterica subsp. enterica serovar Virchow]EDI0983743.1 histidine operon leader peptide [Salmonella enterica subsp. enterica serovar Virchow]